MLASSYELANICNQKPISYFICFPSMTWTSTGTPCVDTSRSVESIRNMETCTLRPTHAYLLSYLHVYFGMFKKMYHAAWWKCMQLLQPIKGWTWASSAPWLQRKPAASWNRNTGSRVSELIIPLYLRLIRPHLDVTSSMGPLNTRGLPSCLELEQLSCEERLKDWVWPSLKKREVQEDLIAAFPSHAVQYLQDNKKTQ